MTTFYIDTDAALGVDRSYLTTVELGKFIPIDGKFCIENLFINYAHVETRRKISKFDNCIINTRYYTSESIEDLKNNKDTTSCIFVDLS